MLTGIRIFASDAIWRGILSDLNATLVDDVLLCDVDFDSLKLNLPVNLFELKSAIVDATDNINILTKLFGRDMDMSPLQAQIVVRLYKSGGMTSDELKMALGYSQDATTHTVDTAIYSLRKKYGHDFIKNNNGKFTIGGI